MKKKIIICTLVAVAIGLAFTFWYANRIIGHLSGPENENVILDNGNCYSVCYDEHSHKDKGLILGRITGSYNTSYYVFSVKDDPDNNFIYIVSFGHGKFYKRTYE